MPLVEIFDASRRPARCRRCGQSIEFAEAVANGARVAFDAPLDVRPGGNLFTSGDDKVVTVNLKVNQLHAVTCPARYAKGR